MFFKSLPWIRSTLLFALPSAAKWLQAFIVIFLYGVIVGTGWVREAPLLSATLLKAIFYVHLSLHVRTSFLPFTVEVIGAIFKSTSRTVTTVWLTYSGRLKQMFGNCMWEGLKLQWGEKEEQIKQDHDGKVPQIHNTWPIYSCSFWKIVNEWKSDWKVSQHK